MQKPHSERTMNFLRPGTISFLAYGLLLLFFVACLQEKVTTVYNDDQAIVLLDTIVWKAATGGPKSSEAQNSSSSETINSSSNIVVNSSSNPTSSNQVSSSNGGNSSQINSSTVQSSDGTSSSGNLSQTSSSTPSSSSVVQSSSSQNQVDPAIANKYMGQPEGNFILEINNDFDSHDPTIWDFSDGSWDGNLSRFQSQNVEFIDGVLNIVMKKEFAAGGYSLAEHGVVQDKDYTSAEYRTKTNGYRYGVYETRMKPPAGSGYVATMFTFHDPKSENWKEIDVELEGMSQDRFTTNLIKGPVWPTDHIAQETVPGGGFNTLDWHTYTIKWTPGKIEWYVDDKSVRVQTQYVPDAYCKIMLNFWITSYGTSFGGPNDGNTYPMSHKYDWFRFYRLEGD